MHAPVCSIENQFAHFPAKASNAALKSPEGIN
jgi:hypothetical protein